MRMNKIPLYHFKFPSIIHQFTHVFIPFNHPNRASMRILDQMNPSPTAGGNQGRSWKVMQRRRKNWLKKFTIGFLIRLAPWRKEMSFGCLFRWWRLMIYNSWRMLDELVIWRWGRLRGRMMMMMVVVVVVVMMIMTMDDGWRWCMYDESQPFERCCMFCWYTRFGNHFGFTHSACSCGIRGKGRSGYAKWAINELHGWSFASLGFCKFTIVCPSAVEIGLPT